METMWVLVIAAAIVAAVAGFFIGRSTGDSKERIAELETEVSRRREEIAEYKKEVEVHFDKTATLFVDMAGSYKALFEHLSSDYEKLSDGSARELFKDRVSAMLLESGSTAERKVIADASEQAVSVARSVDAVAAADAKPAETVEPEVWADDQIAAVNETECKPDPDQGTSTSGSVAGEQEAGEDKGAAPADVAETPVGLKGEGDDKTAEPETAKPETAKPETVKPRADEKALGDDRESTLERAAKKRAESTATEGKGS